MRFILVSTVVLLTAVSSMSQSDSRDIKIADEIRAVMNEQAEDWNRGDVEAFMQGYWKSDKLVFVGSQVTRGWQPTLERYKKSYPDKAAMGTLTFSDLEITLIEGCSGCARKLGSSAREGQSGRQIHAYLPQIQGRLADRSRSHQLS